MLVAFRAVARCGSFAKAAAELHKSQPAGSKLIQNLEAALGIVLFDRASYRARLSDAKLEIIDAGMGWGGLPEHVVAPRLRDGSLVALAIREFDVDTIELCVIRRRDRPHGPVAQALWSRAGTDTAHAPRA